VSPAAPAPRPAPAPDVGSRLSEINAALEELRGEVQQLLRRSEGPPWGHPVLEAAYQALRDRDVEETIARDILAGLDPHVLPEASLGDGALRGLLTAHVARFVRERGGGDGAAVESRGIQILVGPTGVGKTTSIAKLAARDRYARGRRVALVTLDTFRIAAVDQLRKYAEIIGLELKVATDPANLREILDSLAGHDVIYVDSAGRSPADEMRVGELEAFVRALPEAEVSLVLSVTAGGRTLGQAIERFRRVGFSRLILTKLDETQSPGVILSALAEARCPVSFVTNGQNVPDDLEAMDPQRLADLVLRGD
jgi:flagellar biosynthesis protein FlhF